MEYSAEQIGRGPILEWRSRIATRSALAFLSWSRTLALPCTQSSTDEVGQRKPVLLFPTHVTEAGGKESEHKANESSWPFASAENVAFSMDTDQESLSLLQRSLYEACEWSSWIGGMPAAC